MANFMNTISLYLLDPHSTNLQLGRLIHIVCMECTQGSLCNEKHMVSRAGASGYGPDQTCISGSTCSIITLAYSINDAKMAK